MSNESYSEENIPNQGQTIIIRQKSSNRNGIGIAGFILSVISLFIGWVPIVGWLVWGLGAVFSFIGMFIRPRTLAIIGFIISFIELFILLFVLGTLISLGTAMSE